MTREERQQRIDELRRWISEQNEEFRDEGFPNEVQSAWDANNVELREHERVISELEARDARIAELARQNESTERGSDTGGVTRARGAQLISRMGEREVYDLSEVRFNPFNPGSATTELRDRALRAIEVSHFAHPDVSQERAQGHVEGLIRREASDNDGWESGVVARRILATGNPEYKRAFSKLMSAAMHGQAGMAALSPSELRAVEAVRALSIGTGSAGGFAVPFTLDPTVVPTSNYSVNPYRQVCRTAQVTGNTWMGVTAGAVTAAYALEGQEASDNSPTFAQPSMVMQRAQAFVPVSFELTQDWTAVQAEIAQLISDAKDDLESAKFTTGSGTNEPTGLITAATSTVTTTSAASFAIADLYKLEEALAPRFRPRAVVFGNRFAFNKVRQFDTAGGSGVWFGVGSNGYGGLAQSLNDGMTRLNAQILGYPAFEVTAMSSALTTGQKILVMGDPRYYMIVDRIGMDIEVIPHLFGTANNYPTGQRGFYAFWRNNAAALSPAAFKTLVTG